MGVETDSYLTRVGKRLDKIKDPVERARAASDEIAAVADVLARLGAMRTAAVRDARETKSAQTVAAEMGVTRARIYQIAQGRE